MKAWTEIVPDVSLLPGSRIHTLDIPNPCMGNVWVKREDAFGFGMAGTKMRKYASLIPFFIQNKIKQTALIGGAFSNNLVVLPQILKSYGIDAKLFIRGDAHTPIKGNQFLIRLLNAEHQIQWIDRSNWANVEQIAQEYVDDMQQKGCPVHVVPEGAYMPEALPGAITLADDIHRNEAQAGVHFQHIFSDAGTGFATLAGMIHDSAMHPDRNWHILLLADDIPTFHFKLKQVHAWYVEYTKNAIPLPKAFILYQQNTFGKVGQKELESVKHMARTYGMICDPVYSAKLWTLVHQTLQQDIPKGDILVMQSGGASIMGFQDKMAAGLKD